MFSKLYPIGLYIKRLPNLIMLPLSGLINVATWIWLYWQIRPQEEMVFLHYNILFGVDYIGPRSEIIIWPLTGLFIILLNALLGWLFYKQDKFVAYFLNATSLICQIFLFVTASLLVFLNV